MDILYFNNNYNNLELEKKFFEKFEEALNNISIVTISFYG